MNYLARALDYWRHSFVPPYVDRIRVCEPAVLEPHDLLGDGDTPRYTYPVIHEVTILDLLGYADNQLRDAEYMAQRIREAFSHHETDAATFTELGDRTKGYIEQTRADRKRLDYLEGLIRKMPL